MSQESKDQEAVKEVVEKIDKTISEQEPAIDESEWAESPDFNEVDQEALAKAAREGAAKTEYDDTNHADDEQATVEGAKVSKPDENFPGGKDAASEKSEPVEEESTEPKFDPLFIRAAGLNDEEEAKIQFGTPKALENAVRLLDQKSVNLAEAALNAHLQSQTQQQAVAQTPTPAETETEFKMPEPPDGEEWDEATVAIVKSLQEQFTRELRQQQRIIEEQRQATESIISERKQVELRRYVDEFDGFVNKLGDEWKPLLGEGSGYQLEPKSLALKNRVHLDTIAKQLSYGRQQQGLPELPQEELLSRSLRVAFPQQQEKVIRKQVEKEVQKRQGMMTARPSGRAGGRPKQGIDAAAATAEKWYAARGMGSRPGDDMEYDEI